MTIATFCREQLLAHGPLTADELGGRATAAGITRARDPRSSVMSAMRGREIALDAERWVTPLWLLEGRCLTTAALTLMGEGGDDRSEEDLGLLHTAASLLPIPLVGGGFLRHYGWHGWWKSTEPLPVPGSDELLCFRVTAGELAITTVPRSSLASVDSSFADSLNNAAGRRKLSTTNAGTAVQRRLAELLLDDATLLRSPIAPLSTIVDALAEQVRARSARRASDYHDPWASDTAVHLAPHFAWQLEQIAAEQGLGPSEWVERQIDLHRREATPPILRLLP